MENPRNDHNEFLAKALASRDRARLTGKYICASSAIKELEKRLEQAKRRLGG